MKNYKKNDASTKVRILKPILDDWNHVQHDTWEIVKTTCKDICEIRRSVEDSGFGIHGILISNIAGICNSYDWTFGVYNNLAGGVKIQL